MGLFDGITDFLSGGKDSASAGASQSAVDAYKALQAPDVADQQLQLEMLVQQGQLTPAQAQAILQQQSELKDVYTDPRLKDAQLAALNGLQDVANQGGLTAIDKARLNEISQEQAAEAKGARDAIIQNAQARGVGGSGLELLAQLQNQQASATRASNQGFDVAAEAQKRALDALQQSGALAGQMQSNDFNQKAQVAAAQDAINKFNAANMQDVANRNVQSINDAQKANLAEKQRVADSNVQLRNNQQQYNKQLLQQQYENQLKRAGGMSGAYSNQSQSLAQQGAANKQFVGDLISTGATAAAAASDKNLKKDIEKDDFNAEDFLDSLTGYKYRYRDSKYGKGEQTGVMAQDLEKTKAGKAMVVDTPEGKMVDYGKGFGAIAAALANVHDRVKKLEKGGK